MATRYEPMADFHPCNACEMRSACRIARHCALSTTGAPTVPRAAEIVRDDRVRWFAEITYDLGYEDAKNGRANSNPHRRKT